MSTRLLAAFVAALFVFTGCQTGPSTDFADIENRPLEEQVAYIVGFSSGEGLHGQIEGDSTVTLDYDLVAGAYYAGVRGDSSMFSDERAQEIMLAFQDTMILRQPQVKAAAAAADSFLTANATAEGVTVTESGLQYQVIESGDGTGASPSMGDRVTVNYEGRLLDGTVFDSSFRRGEPTQFTVGEVIAGWNEGLALMQVGDNWRLFIPADLAYGLRPNPRSGIPPNAMLIFDVELLGVGSDTAVE